MKINTMKLPGVNTTVKIGQSKQGCHYVHVDSLCEALFIARGRLKIGTGFGGVPDWLTTDQVITALVPYIHSHPSVNQFLKAASTEGVKHIHPGGLPIEELASMIGVSVAEIEETLEDVREKRGR